MRPRTLISRRPARTRWNRMWGRPNQLCPLPDTTLGRVVVYRNGVAYFERYGQRREATPSASPSPPTRSTTSSSRSPSSTPRPASPRPSPIPTAGRATRAGRPHRHEDQPSGPDAAPAQALVRHRVAVVEAELPAGDRQGRQGRRAGVGDRRQHLGRGLEPDQARRRLELGDVVPLRSALGPAGRARDAPLGRSLRAGAADGRRDLRPGRRHDAGARRAERLQPRQRDGRRRRRREHPISGAGPGRPRDAAGTPTPSGPGRRTRRDELMADEGSGAARGARRRAEEGRDAPQRDAARRRRRRRPRPARSPRWRAGFSGRATRSSSRATPTAATATSTPPRSTAPTGCASSSSATACRPTASSPWARASSRATRAACASSRRRRRAPPAGDKQGRRRAGARPQAQPRTPSGRRTSSPTAR